MGIKLFTVNEANGLLAEVRGSLHSLRRIRDEMAELEKKKAVEELSWLKEDGSVSPRAQRETDILEKALESKGKVFEEKLGLLNALGVQLKDLEEGLIDFFTEREGKLVYLCWKDGEDQIRYWHDMDSGFAGRRPLKPS